MIAVWGVRTNDGQGTKFDAHRMIFSESAVTLDGVLSPSVALKF